MKVYFVQYIQLRRPCAIDTAVESNIGPSGPGTNGHRAIGELARFHLSCDRYYLGKHYDNWAGFGQACSEMCI